MAKEGHNSEHSNTDSSSTAASESGINATRSQEVNEKPPLNNNNNNNEQPTAYDNAENRPVHPVTSADMGAAMSRTRTETAASLRHVVSNVPEIDTNFPSMMVEPTRAEFPEEYTMETETGLVPVATLREMRTIPSVVSATENQNEGDLEKRKSAEFVTFTIDDPDNPLNWSRGYKWYVTLTVSALVICDAFASSNVTGGLGLIEEKYHVSQEVAILTCSIMVMGFAAGPLLWSPLSEQIGRRPVYVVTLFMFCVMNIPCALSPNIGGLLASRFVQGVFASSGLVLAGGTIADIWIKEDRGMAIAYFAAAPYCGPVFGPLICGFINVGSGRLDLFFWVTLAFSGLMFFMVGLIPETYSPTILKSRAKRLRKETGNMNIMTEQEALAPSMKEIIKSILARPMYMIMTEPVLDLMNSYIVLIYSLLYAFFFAYPVIFGELHGYGDNKIGMMFIPILIGAVFALCTTPIIEKGYHKICREREPTPEDRLIAAMIGAPFVPIALFILGATSYRHIIWVGPSSSGLAFGYGMVMIYFSVNNYIIDAYQKYAASALAAKVFLRSGGGAAFPLFTTQMYHRLGLQWASWLLAFISLAMVVIPFIFYKYGATLRQKWSKPELYMV